MLGYSDRSKFERAFVKEYRLTPTKYRQKKGISKPELTVAVANN
jgi:AraC-like DNA-binding protein